MKKEKNLTEFKPIFSLMENFIAISWLILMENGTDFRSLKKCNSTD
jgi:hypothetical protein